MTGNPVDNGATTVSLAAKRLCNVYDRCLGSIVGNAANSNTNNFGIKNIQFQGFSNVFRVQPWDRAGIGYVPASMVGVGPFAGQSTCQAMLTPATRQTRHGQRARQPDGIVDFGKTHPKQRLIPTAMN
jgi:hypothetical protein